MCEHVSATRRKATPVPPDRVQAIQSAEPLHQFMIPESRIWVNSASDNVFTGRCRQEGKFNRTRSHLHWFRSYACQWGTSDPLPQPGILEALD